MFSQRKIFSDQCQAEYLISADTLFWWHGCCVNFIICTGNIVTWLTTELAPAGWPIGNAKDLRHAPVYRYSSLVIKNSRCDQLCGQPFHSRTVCSCPRVGCETEGQPARGGFRGGGSRGSGPPLSYMKNDVMHTAIYAALCMLPSLDLQDCTSF